jgi:hypothetical protein
MRLEQSPFLFCGLAGRVSVCDMDVEALGDGRVVVICTEREDNPGTCVTHSVAFLARTVCRYWDLHPAQLVWIEHNPARGEGAGYLRATWELVTFRWDGRSAGVPNFSHPAWRPMGYVDWWELGLSSPEAEGQEGQGDVPAR